ncbi:MAG: dockerin type I repeat-containing protein [Nitrososphaerota archaeon]|nr:dockerin type I repeat-containing protein [Nitrososphaerota archaeon]
MKKIFKTKIFFGLFIAFTLTLTSVLSTGFLAPAPVYAQEYPTGPAEGYLDAVKNNLSKFPGADIDWWLANPDATEFCISTPAELWGLAYLVNNEVESPHLSGWVWTVEFTGKVIHLTNDIDLSTINPGYTKTIYTYGETWRPIGWGPSYERPTDPPGAPGNGYFMGTFEGNDYTVSGLADYSLFGVIKNASIKNLSTSGTVTTQKEINLQHRISGVVDMAVDSTISNLKSDVHMVYSQVSFSPMGGIVSETVGNTIISDCEFKGTIDNQLSAYGGANPVGGIIGSIGAASCDATVTIKDCINYADIIAAGKGGGIIGGTILSTRNALSANIIIQDCVNYGDITDVGTVNVAAYAVGGILGASSSTVAPACPMSVTIESCVNYGAVSGGIHAAGGVAGYIQQGNLLSLTNSYNRGDAISQVASGGIVGRIDNANGAVIENTYDTGVVTGTNVGGFVGLVNGGTVDSINNYYLDTSASGAANSADYTGVTTKTATEMKTPAFAIQLGNAYTAITDDYPILTWQTSSNTDPVIISPDVTVVTLNGDTNIIAGSDATYTISVGNVNKLATITLWIEVNGTYFTGKTFNGLNGFNLLGNIDWTQNGNTWIGRATLINLNSNGVSSNNVLDIFELVFSSNSNQLGTTNVKLVKADLSGYNDNTNKAIPIDTAITNNTIHTLISPYFPKYDINKDGKINQLDLTTAQLYYLSEESDANWNTAKTADINGDGRVDIEDLILILNNINWSSPLF